MNKLVVRFIILIEIRKLTFKTFIWNSIIMLTTTILEI